MFYYFRLEDQIPEHHLLRRIAGDFRFVRERLRDARSGFWDCRGDEGPGTPPLLTHQRPANTLRVDGQHGRFVE